MRRLRPKRMVVYVDEELKMSPWLFVATVVIAFDSRFFDFAAHALHLALDPWLVGLGQVVSDVVPAVNPIERRTLY